MGKPNDGGPAFPGLWQDTFSGKVSSAPTGITVRDYFAAKALPSVMAELSVAAPTTSDDGQNLNIARAAVISFKIADYMLAARAGEVRS